MRIKKLLQEVVVWCYNPLYNYIGSKTKPTEAEQCELGDWWVRISSQDPQFKYLNEHGDNRYKYCYQRLEQDSWGRWKNTNMFLGRHYSLSAYREYLRPNARK